MKCFRFDKLVISSGRTLETTFFHALFLRENVSHCLENNGKVKTNENGNYLVSLVFDF